MESGQMMMFEPEGAKLVELVGVYLKNANFEAKRAINLLQCGYVASANACAQASREGFDNAAICENALQFEVLARLK